MFSDWFDERFTAAGARSFLFSPVRAVVGFIIWALLGLSVVRSALPHLRQRLGLAGALQPARPGARADGSLAAHAGDHPDLGPDPGRHGRRAFGLGHHSHLGLLRKRLPTILDTVDAMLVLVTIPLNAATGRHEAAA